MKKWLALLCSLMLCTACAAAEPADATLISVNVRKADCHLLFVGDAVYMIDTGTAESWGAVSAVLSALNVTHLNGVILTHTDKDHAGGIMALATSSVAVDAWYASAYFVNMKRSKHPAVLAAALRGQEVVWLKGGDTLPVPVGTLAVLGPTVEDEKENNDSLVLRLDVNGGSMLLTGDMEFPEEQTLLDADLLAPCTVLKVGNHANDDATSAAFINAVKPKLAIISTNSDDEPDTPSTRILTLLKSAGAQIALTQSAQGALRTTLTGTSAAIETLAFTPPAQTLSLTLSDKSVAQDAVTLRNDGTAVADLGGCFITSSRGGEVFVFPVGATLASGASCTVTSYGSEDAGDYVWPDDRVWHKSKDDQARLYDAWGRLLSVLD